MEITEVRIKLMEDSEDRLQAFCSITIDECFVIRDLKIIDGSNGPFVAMPSRKLTGHCHQCGQKNHLRAHFCNGCGAKLNHRSHANEPPQKLYADIAHPINSECRERIQQIVIDEFRAELDRSSQPGYRSRYDDDFDDDFEPDDYSVPAQGVVEDAAAPGLIREDAKAKRGVPRPHFNDRSSTGPASRIGSPNPNLTGHSGEDPAVDQREDGFGAGIFDE
ncbi:MAG: SpoVG family protein [Planctomycetota bacterium]